MKKFIKPISATVLFLGFFYFLFINTHFFGLQSIDMLPLDNQNAGFILYLFILFLLFSFTVIIKLIRQILRINRKLEQIQSTVL